MIETLTKEQEALIPKIRDKWLKIARSTGKSDRKKAEKGIDLIYRELGLKKPEIKWFLSPKSLSEYAEKHHIREQVEQRLDEQLWGLYWSQISTLVADCVWDQVKNQIGDRIERQTYSLCSGQYDAYWLAEYEFYSHLGIDIAKTEGLYLIAESAGIWIGDEKTVLISERPISISLDEDGELHSLDGPAIEFADGYSLYRRHGKEMSNLEILATAGK